MTKAIIAAFAAMLAVAVVRPVRAEPQPEGDRTDRKAAVERICVKHDADTFITRISIRATGGRVAWADVARGLARARGYDDMALEGVLPQGSFDVARTQWRLLLIGLNLALKPHVCFEVERPEGESDQPRLVITLDRAALLASRRHFTARLREALLHWRGGGKRQYGLVPDEGWSRAPAKRNLVVFVHGIESQPRQLEGLLTVARDEGHPCAVFSYPNDQPIADSAKLLSRELRRLAEDHPDRGVSLLTHSMGGLVARATIEDGDLDPGNVRQLIMLAPPNHGSALARFAFGLELHEHVAGSIRKKKIDIFFAAVEDGLSEATGDLMPHSPFLRELNARGHNPAVRYSIFLGTDAPLTEQELKALRRSVAAAGERNRWVQFLGSRVHKWLGDLDEVVDGRGDGVVSLERGRLEGVKDTVVLKFGHVSVLQSPAHGDVRRAHQEILKRLKPSGQGRLGMYPRDRGDPQVPAHVPKE